MVAVTDLTGLPLFASATPDELEKLAALFDIQTAGEGVRLVSEGASGYFFFIVLEGSAVVNLGDDVVVATYRPGDFFGEQAILGGTRRNATVTTTSPAKLLVMHGTQFRRLQQEHPGIAARIEEVTQQRRDELLALQQRAEGSG